MGKYYNDSHIYDDIINMQHHRSKDRVHMSLHDRAAQFAPFAALTGYEETIAETARLTDKKIIIDDSEIEKINEMLRYLTEHLSDRIQVSITYFKADKTKHGGAYLTDVGIIKKIDKIEGGVIMENSIKIRMGDIRGIEYSV